MFKKSSLTILLVGLTLLTAQPALHANDTSKRILRPYSPDTDEQLLTKMISVNLEEDIEPILFGEYIVDDIDPIKIKPLNNCFFIRSSHENLQTGLLAYKSVNGNGASLLDLDFIFDFSAMQEENNRAALKKMLACAITELVIMKKQENYDALMWVWTSNRDEDPRLVGTILEELKFTKQEWSLPGIISGITYCLPLNNSGKAKVDGYVMSYLI